MKRKLLMIFLTLVMITCSIVGLTACGNSQEPPHEHSYSTEWTRTDTHHYHACTCGEKQEYNEHNFDSGREVLAPTETQKGEKLLTCLACNFTKIEEIPTTGITPDNPEPETPEHTHDYKTTITAPKCDKQGYTIYTCDCGDSYVSDYINALEHEFTNYEYNNDAKCGVNGTETATCNHGCGTTDKREKANTALTHSFTIYYSDKNATYEKDGTKTATCDNGCGTIDTIEDIGSKLEENEIRFNTLSVDGANVYGKVSNSTTEFRFYEEITVSGIATYVVDNDKSCSSPINSKVVDLSVGDNIFYVLETVENDVALYTVIIRRRPMYTVEFNTNGGTNVDNQQIEEDGLAVEPTTSKTGYTFDGWDYDFTTPITDYTTIDAKWTANTDTPYKVEYYLENLEDDNYSLQMFQNKTGTTDTFVEAEIKTFAHFTYKKSSTDSSNIAPEGSTVLKVYYTRNTYTVIFNGNGGTLSSGNSVQQIKYSGSAVSPTFTKNGYTFNSWDKNFYNINQDTTITASWDVITYTITYENLKGAANPNPTTYTIESETIALQNLCNIGGYNFFSWKGPNGYTSQINKGDYGNITLTADWEQLFIVEEGVITGCRSKLIDVVIPENIDGETITGIGICAFQDRVFNSVEMPSTVISIGQRAFAGCKSLKTVMISKNVEVIGFEAFYYCEKLTNIEIPNSIKEIGDRAFWGCSSLIYTQYDNCGYLGNSENKYLYLGKKIESSTFITINNQCKIIGYRAFCGSSTLENINIPNSIEKIGSEAFYRCSSLANVYYGGTINEWVDIVFYGGDANPLSNYGAILYINGAQQIDIVISTENIRDYAFYKYSSLINVTITSSVKNIGAYSFYYCNILDINIDNSLKTIGNFAFYACNFENIIFNGSTAEFDCIKKGDVWYHGFVEITVQCADGRILISK